MKLPTLAGIVALATLALLLPGTLFSQEKQGQQPTPEEQAEMMAKWMATIQPGEMHELLARRVGKWTTKSKMWWEGPQGPVTETSGSAEFRSIMGGRFVVEETKGTVMEMPFEGMGITGYDNFRKVFHTYWVDNFGTGSVNGHGVVDPSGETITFYAAMDEPMTGEVGKPTRWVLRFVNDDTIVFEVYDPVWGEQGKVMEITYSRAQEK